MLRVPSSVQRDAMRGLPEGFSPIQNILLGQGRQLLATILDPARLIQSVQAALPDLDAPAVARLAAVLSAKGHAIADPIVQSV